MTDTTNTSNKNEAPATTKPAANNSNRPPKDKKHSNGKSKMVSNKTPKQSAKTVNKKPNPTQKDTATTKKTKSSNGKPLASAAIILALLIGGGLFFVGKTQIDKQNNYLNTLQLKINQLEQANTTLQANSNKTATLLEKDLTAMNLNVTTALANNETKISQQIADITSIQKAVTELKGRRPNDWLMTESDYLVKMASRKLWLEHDIHSATQLLVAADSRLAELNDHSLSAVRKDLAQDIIALKALPRLDADGLVIRISSLETQLDSLPLNGSKFKEIRPFEPAKVSSSVADWKSNLLASAKQFGDNFITVREIEGQVVPPLAPVQHFYVQENIKAKLETAISSVYRENGELYIKSLDLAKNWVAEFYNIENPAVKNFIKTLDQLAQQPVQLKYPRNLLSPKALTDLINTRLRKQVIGINSKGNK